MTVSAAKDPMGHAGVRWTNNLDYLAVRALLTSPVDLHLMPELASRQCTLVAKKAHLAKMRVPVKAGLFSMSF